jgi:hypothetical protein
MTDDETTLDQLRRRIDELAREEVPQLLEEARIEARAQVRTMLVEAIAERMLAHADAEVGVEPAARSEPRARADARAEASAERSRLREPAPARAPVARERARDNDAERELGWYVYGVVAEGYEPPEQLVGIDDEHDVTVVPAEGIAAVASRVPLDEFGEEALTEQVSDLGWLETNARRHEYILDRVREHTTLVPMRLCTIYQGDASVREMLAREHEFLVGALERLEGRTEWGVKLFAGPSALRSSDAPREGDEELRESGPGAAYLLEKRLQDRRAAEAESVLEERCVAAHERLAALAVEAKLNPVQPRELTKREEQMLLNGVYLVEDRASSEFASAAGALQAEYEAEGIELELTGPWPPYNFVNDAREVGR